MAQERPGPGDSVLENRQSVRLQTGTIWNDDHMDTKVWQPHTELQHLRMCPCGSTSTSERAYTSKFSLPRTQSIRKVVRRARARKMPRILSAFPNADEYSSLGALSTISDPFPVRKFVKLMWQQYNVLSLANTQLATTVSVVLNSAYDPFGQGSGDRQPYGYSSMASIYNKYFVRRVHLSVEFTNPSADQVNVGIQVAGTTPSGLAQDIIAQRPWTIVKSLNDSGSQCHTFSITIDLHEAFGLSRRQYEDEPSEFGAGISANPTKTISAFVWATGPPGATATVGYRIRAVYETQFWERATLASSTIA